jgi:hypothetical protein
MKRHAATVVVAVALAAAIAAAGCAKTETLNLVTGKVLYQGKPLAGALVSFHPHNGKTSPPTGLTKDDGTFSVMTGDVEGAPPGAYTVTIICQTPVNTKAEGTSFGPSFDTEDRLKGAYANRDQSQIKVEIKDGPNQLEPFDLK